MVWAAMSEPEVLTVTSHKGGTGRTTTACALAWLCGREGLRVALVDADPARTARLIALDRNGDCRWDNVRYHDGMPEPLDPLPVADMVIVDAPALSDPAAGAVLSRSRGVVLTCLADPLSLRTIPAAARALATARVANADLELLGVLIGRYDAGDEIQSAMLDRLRMTHGDMLLEPPTPEDAELRDWALAPGAPLPPGPGADALEQLREIIMGRRLSVASGIQ